MKRYLAVFTISLQTWFIYPFNLFIWRIRQFILFLIPLFLWTSVYSQHQLFGSYNLTQMLTYVFGVIILRALVLGSKTIDLGNLINSGKLSLILMKPFSPFLFFFIRDLADKVFNLSFLFLELPLLWFFFHPPILIQTNFLTLIVSLFSLLLAVLIYFYLNLIFGSLGFWTRDIWAPKFLLLVILELTTGAMIPLDLLPLSLTKLVYLTPFPYLIYIPLNFYLGKLTSFKFIYFQLIWLILLFYFAQFIWHKGLLRYEASGN